MLICDKIKFYRWVNFDCLQKLGFKKYSLLGWSDGGISSLIAAAKYPDEVEKLVVWGSNAYVLPEEIETFESK